jgi:hypothetical protein
MQQINSLANSVYIWLGPGNEDSDKAMDYSNKRARLGRRLPLKLLATTDAKAEGHVYSLYRRQAWCDVKGELI